MVATTFAADTPLAVTGLVYANGVAGNWLWWSFLPSGMMTVFLFARLWRRSGLITDVQFAEFRYHGKPAAFLRGFRAIYLGLLMNCLILGWVTKAMVNIISTAMGVSDAKALAICVFFLMPFTGIYVSLGGLWGVLWTDLFQFILKMAIVISVAWCGVRAVGGMPQLLAALAAKRAAAGPGASDITALLPDFSRGLTGEALWTLPVITFVVHLAVQWWAFWYPGAEPGGGGYVVQNIAATRSEREGRAAALYFNIAHYAIRSWPWVITALCSLVLYGGAVKAEDPGVNYVQVMVDLLPNGLRGFMLASFAAAYSSTIATQMNWGSSYLVNDLYRRFIVRNASERHYVYASWMAVALTLVLSVIVTAFMDQISGAWQFLMMLGAGTGLVYILRWYWWRINAWSEVSAMTAALVTSLTLRLFIDSSTAAGFALNLIVTTVITTIVWLIVTFATKPEPEETLQSFYRRARPAGRGWERIAQQTGIRAPKGELALNAIAWVLGIVLVYSIMFATGALIFDERRNLIVFGSLLIISSVGLWEVLRREKRLDSEANAA